jgi:hypothetical protein
MYTSAETKAAPTCGVCGRKLGVGFYSSCHVCGATYCYTHTPQKCKHPKANSPALQAQLRR